MPPSTRLDVTLANGIAQRAVHVPVPSTRSDVDFPPMDPTPNGEMEIFGDVENMPEEGNPFVEEGG